jgi:hypothetical protein
VKGSLIITIRLRPSSQKTALLADNVTWQNSQPCREQSVAIHNIDTTCFVKLDINFSKFFTERAHVYILQDVQKSCDLELCINYENQQMLFKNLEKLHSHFQKNEKSSYEARSTSGVFQ